MLLFPLFAHHRANLQANVAGWNETECIDTTLGFQCSSPMTRRSAAFNFLAGVTNPDIGSSVWVLLRQLSLPWLRYLAL